MEYSAARAVTERKTEALVKRHLIYRTLSVSACSICCFLPASAQENGAGLVFGFNQSLETDDNLDLDPVSAGRTTFASTGLSLGFTHETPLDRIGVSASGVLRAVNGPGAESGWDNQRFQLDYGREGVQSAFGFNASYLQSNIEFLRPLQDFENPDGEIELPPDLDDLNGTGNRERYRSGLEFELGRDAPIGADFRANYLSLKYTDTTDPGLNDSDRINLDANLYLRFLPFAEGIIGADYRFFDQNDAEQTQRETKTGYAGVNVELSPIWRLEARFGYTTIDTREFGITTRTDGPTGLLRLERDMPNGTIDAELSQIVTDDGDIRNYLVGRSLELPTGGLAFTAGFADSELDSPDFIGSLNWVQELPRGEFSARFQRSLDFDEDKGNILRTALFLGYFHEINNISGINLNAGYTISDELTRTIDRANVTASYQYSLTEDWALSTGYRYRMREELTDPRAQSHSIFFNIGRDFIMRP
ncbi:hypothetical protein [Ruegeria atlantica]|uniref:Outer membrane beta-barrel protein n=1 Tax=Ruegeria atlantica TaxID=81569 RepID=A0A0P1F020_9RHOB|nr:hypothetical protein [Ruegeria atlantica]CUH49067.1 hypothetical protein RUA4292_03261 [Ruegeria atlantica]